MLFNSFEFPIFLATVFLLYWFVFQRNLKAQNLLVVVASYTFNYLLKPFNKSEYLDDFSPAVHQAIGDIPFGWLSKYDFIKRSNWALKLRSNNNIHDFKMAPISVEYLLKMESLCQRQGISFSVHSPFMSDPIQSRSQQI